MENTILRNFADNNLTFYKRYVDDSLCVIKKWSTETLLAEMNNFKQNLKLTSEKKLMVN